MAPRKVKAPAATTVPPVPTFDFMGEQFTARPITLGTMLLWARDADISADDIVPTLLVCDKVLRLAIPPEEHDRYEAALIRVTSGGQLYAAVTEVFRLTNERPTPAPSS